MSGLDIFALLVLAVLAATALGVAVALAKLPGQLAMKRGHSKAEAINVAGWLGLLNGISWIVAMIWAFTEGEPPAPAEADEEAAS